MKSKRIIPILFILILSLFPTPPFVESAGYGKENENLGQFTDDFENDDNVSVAVNVINNQTLDCMELNYTTGLLDWFNESWAYRKGHEVEGSDDGPQTDYQIGIKVYYGSGSDGNETVDGIQFGKVYLDNLCQTDFDDIRFTNGSGTDELFYWIEEKVNSDYAIFWVRIPSMPKSPNTFTVYLYYGNNGVSTTSDGKNTFPDLFDHFLGSSLNLTVWNVDASDGSATVAGSIVKVQGNAGALRYAFSSKVPFRTSYNHSLRYRSLIELTVADFQITQIGWGTWGTLLYGMSRSIAGVEQAVWRDSDGNVENDVISDVYFDSYFVYEITRTGTVGELFVDGVSVATGDMNPDSDVIGAQLYCRDSEFDLYCDWILIRNWVPNEPTHINWTIATTGVGYVWDGYFTTEDYLNYTTGQGLALLTNASIPVNTSITVQFSNDNATWVDNEGNVGSTPVLNGFYAIDLRDLNYTDSFKMYNLTTTDSTITPRLFQSRLVTTNGTAGVGPPGATVIHNVTGEWVYYNLTSINVTFGTHDTGTVNSTLDIDGDTWNCSEVVGAPGYRLKFNWTDVDQDSSCLWVTAYVFYDGVSAHTITIDLWNFTSTAWVTIGTIYDMTDFEWVNSSIYDLRMPNDFINSTGAVLGRFNHASAGNVNDDIHVEFLKLYAFIPFEDEAVTVESFFWIPIAIVLSIIAGLLVWLQYEHK